MLNRTVVDLNIKFDCTVKLISVNDLKCRITVLVTGRLQKTRYHVLPDLIRHEIDAINEKWREIEKGSERKGEGLGNLFSDPKKL